MSERDAPIKEITGYLVCREGRTNKGDYRLPRISERDVQIKEITGYLVGQRGMHQ
jgi:hypothetical protein